ncbi:hypothetical protein K504DRAFT_530870 [Pleomassaria siparia CBS 279.74]|uniref:Uncharacterized protein n=1 Tax=Pleomassaria siparia CBS 279.74 TaxID=1314801 RepID=A0A6G1KMB5_9PLEO|nr:hypothetical protein K504DRAFT_530870 [Pleomassaria siparia CBS 279.74]
MSFLDFNFSHYDLGSSSYFYNYDGFAQYANPPTNYLGTGLFLGYIALALVCTGWIMWDSWTRYDALIASPKSEKASANTKDESEKKEETPSQGLDIRNARARHIKIYAVLASISFAMLSFHMLNFLIASYQQWNGGGSADLSVEKMKSWMLETGLFESFAMELVDDGPSTVWMQIGVMGIWFWGVWMSGKANERAFSGRSMLPYILLSQILPISFTAALFLIHLHLSSPDLASTAPEPALEKTTTATTRSSHTSPETHPVPLSLHPIHRKTSLLLPTILLNAVLLSIAPLRQHRLFIPLVLFTRIMLLLPFTGRISTRSVEMKRSMFVSWGFLVANLMVLLKGYQLGDVFAVLRGGQFGGSAVRALGWDAIMGCVLERVVGWGGGV